MVCKSLNDTVVSIGGKEIGNKHSDLTCICAWPIILGVLLARKNNGIAPGLYTRIHARAHDDVDVDEAMRYDTVAGRETFAYLLDPRPVLPHRTGCGVVGTFPRSVSHIYTHTARARVRLLFQGDCIFGRAR
jgi:hypothetical protein